MRIKDNNADCFYHPYSRSVMGAVDIAVRGLGTSMNDAFKRLRQESDEQDGTDAYSGGFNSIQEYHNLTLAWQASGMQALDFLEEADRMEQLDKREANAVCLRAPTREQEGEIYLSAGQLNSHSRPPIDRPGRILAAGPLCVKIRGLFTQRCAFAQRRGCLLRINSNNAKPLFTL